MNCSVCSTPLPEGAQRCVACGNELTDSGEARKRAALEELADTLRAAVSGRYRIERLLGRGAMGAVFLAQDLRLERDVAIKVLRPDLAEDPGCVGRFERESRISARLDHPNIVPIFAVEQLGDFHYFVMKYVRGSPLDLLLQGGPLAVPHAVSLLWQAACGLGHAHQRGVIHRDVKPSNLMVDEQDRVLVTDFGISKAMEASTQYTSIGQIVGTPRYLSPEQAQSEPLDGRSDQYSLAVVGYELLTGRPPFLGTTLHALMYAHIFQTPAAARSVRPEIPPHVSEALARALSKPRAQRFATMEEFATALWPERPVMAGPLEPVPVQPPAVRSGIEPTVATGSTRRRLLMWGVAGLTGLAAAAALLIFGHRAPIHSGGGDAVTEYDSAGRQAEIGAKSPETTSAPLPAPLPSSPAPAVPDSHAVSSAPAPAVPRREAAPKRARRAAPGRVDTAPAPATAPPSLGYLTINAVPYGTVSVDGVEIGDTPVVHYQLSVGDHLVRVSREGYRPDSVRISITAGNEVRVSRSLTRAGQ